jgi:hypothetical protein
MIHLFSIEPNEQKSVSLFPEYSPSKQFRFSQCARLSNLAIESPTYLTNTPNPS